MPLALLRWIPCLLLVGAWSLPLHVLPWVSWHNEQLATAALLVACIGALVVAARERVPIVLPRVAWLPLAIAAIAGLQFAAGRIVYAGSLWSILQYVFAACAAAALGASCRDRTSALQALAWTLIAGAAVQLIASAGQVFSLWPGADWVARTAYETRAGGNLAQPNQAALLIVLAGASATFLFVSRRIGATALGSMLALLAVGLAMTQSRSGLLASLVLAIGFAWRAPRLGVRRGRLGALVLGVALLLLFQLWPVLAGSYWVQAAEEVNVTTSGRRVMWMQFLDAVQLRPLTGWGVMQVAEAQNAIADRYPEVMAATFAHDAWLDLALWAGVPFALAAAVATLVWLRARLRDTATAEGCLCAGLVVPMLVQSLTEFPYAYLYFLIPVAFAAGAWEAMAPRATRPVHLQRRVAAALVAASAVLNAWAAREYLQIEEDFRVARFEALRVGRTPADYARPPVHLLTQLDALLQGTRLHPEAGMPPADLALLRNVAMLYPWGATCFRYAVALALNDDLDEAKRQLAIYRATQGERSYRRMLVVLDEMAPDRSAQLQPRTAP